MRLTMTEDMLTKAKTSTLEDQFWQELHVLGQYWHPNLVPVIGACLQPGSPLCIVYPYMHGGSLRDRLFGRGASAAPSGSPGGRGPGGLNYVQRLSAATGACFGLAYLHSRTHTPWVEELPEGADDRKTSIIHRDIKTDNILLDEDLNARLADCGLAADLAGNETGRTMNLAGSEGYLDPEAIMTGHFGERSDGESISLGASEGPGGGAARDRGGSPRSHPPLLPSSPPPFFLFCCRAPSPYVFASSSPLLSPPRLASRLPLAIAIAPVYAMGIVLLELLTGVPARSVDLSPQNLVARVWPTLLANPADIADQEVSEGGGCGR